MQKRLVELRERLLRAGVARRHVGRYLRELADHFADVCAEEEARGKSQTEAATAALARLGSVEELAQAMLVRPELQALSARAPWAVFGVGPVACLVATYGTACAILFSGGASSCRGARRPLSDLVDRAIDFGIGRLLYWGGPLVVGWCIAMVAGAAEAEDEIATFGNGCGGIDRLPGAGACPTARCQWCVGAGSLGLTGGRREGTPWCSLRMRRRCLWVWCCRMRCGVWRGCAWPMFER